MYSVTLVFNTPGREFSHISPQLQTKIDELAVQNGLCHLFLPHTSASLILCENADPQVLRDLEAFIQRLIPDGDALLQHTDEGPDDMPAHIRTVLTQNSLLIPIQAGRLALGTWQGIFLWEHRWQPHQRQLLMTIMD